MPLLFLVIALVGWIRRVKLYEAFVQGAEQGFVTAVRIIPYLVGMMTAISVFRASGAMDLCARLLAPVLQPLGIPAEVLPLALMRPLSGGAALGVAADLIRTYGPDSFLGRLASVMQGSTDTTFYVLSVYFGSVGITRYRYAVALGLTADVVSFLAAVVICRQVFA
ncbi:MAG: spore maturation protein [Clostridia bacterium]|nr:spore maturation protein [Clostridia bacterium]